MIRTVGLTGDQAARLGVPTAPLDLPLQGGELPSSPEAESSGGWIVLSGAAPPETLDTLVRAVLRNPHRWSLLLAQVEADEEGNEAGGAEAPLRLVPLSVGTPLPTAIVVERMASAPGCLSLRHALPEIARIRHDLNNPLTAAMAETQLMRMDSDDEGLAVVETQLRRLRDMIAELAQWRLPR